jgi:uncharacterized protein YjbI with pentapeptide repeats
MAADENILKLGDAILAHLLTQMAPKDLDIYRRISMATILTSPQVRNRTLKFAPQKNFGMPELAGMSNAFAGFSKHLSVKNVLRHPSVRSMLARDQIIAELHSETASRSLAFLLPRELLRLIATKIEKDEQAISQLWHMSRSREFQAMAVSILHAAGFKWTPDTEGEHSKLPLNLSAGFLDGIDFTKANLRSARFLGTDLSQARFTGGVLAFADFTDANLRRANLHRVSMESVIAIDANFSRADLSGVQAPLANFDRANLSDANLESAVLQGAFLSNANLDRARLMRSDLSKTNFRKASFAQADFTAAKLDGAILSDLCLRGATFTGASFAKADLNHSDLEFMELPAANFSEANLTGAYLTGTFIPKGNFSGANLKAAGLAEIHWERADLRNADLRGVSFHMGSSRSGHVNSTIACEGSRTGFYTDDYYDQSFKAPEQIRKANLRGADLRGANIRGVDFYLVDLREALYDLQHEEHLRRCGAILETRV